MKQKKHWVKTTPYGNYKDYRKIFVDHAHECAVNTCRLIGLRHPGSKKMNALRTHLN